MEIVWRNHSVRKRAEKQARSSLIAKRRLIQLKNAACFRDIPASAHAHFLKGDLKGFFAIDFGYPARLICEPIGEYSEQDGEFDKTSIKSIEIVNIESDYHSS